MNYSEYKRKKKKEMILIIVVLVLMMAGAAFLHWSNKSLVMTEYRHAGKDVPKAFDGFRIVQVSDLQSEYFGTGQENLLETVQRAKGDIIVFTGDLLDRNHTDYDAARTAMKGLLETAPVFYVNGNHEMALEEERIMAFYEELQEMGVHVLFDRGETVEKDGEKIHLLGLSEFTVFSCKNNERSNKIKADQFMLKYALEHLEEPVQEDDFTVLLAHEPQYLELYDSPKIDLIFAGHAHGGQIRLPFTDGLYAPGQGVLPEMTSGVHTAAYSTLVVSRGLGNSTFPFRVFNRPEIVVVELAAME